MGTVQRVAASIGFLSLLALSATAAPGQATTQATTQAAPPSAALWRMQDAKSALWGYVDRDLKWVIPAKYLQAEPFDGSWAGVALRGKGTAKKWGLIDDTGREIVPPAWAAPLRFAEGVAIVPTSDKADAWTYVDSSGKPLFAQTFADAQPFSEGLAWATTADYLRGYMNREGKFIILNARVIDTGQPFSEGKAVVQRNDNTFRVIDATGKELFAGKGHAEKFSEGLLRFSTPDGQWGFFDPTGKLAIPPTYLAAGDFHDGRAAVQTPAGLGYIDAAGEMVVPAHFSVADSFAGGVAVAGTQGLLGLIDRAGKWVVAPIFVEAGELVNGRALMTERITPTAERVRLMGAGEDATLNPQNITPPDGLLSLLSADIEGLPATVGGGEKLSAAQKTRLQTALATARGPKPEDALPALTALRKEKVVAASVILGRMYQLGIGVNEDGKLAAACYLEGALGKDNFALFEYGRLRCEGPDEGRDLPEAVDAFVRGAAAREGAAERYLAYLSLDGRVLEVNPGLALDHAQKAAKLGDAKAEAAVGIFLEKGFGTKADAAGALKAFEAAAAKGEAAGKAGVERLAGAATRVRG